MYLEYVKEGLDDDVSHKKISKEKIKIKTYSDVYIHEKNNKIIVVPKKNLKN